MLNNSPFRLIHELSANLAALNALRFCATLALLLAIAQILCATPVFAAAGLTSEHIASSAMRMAKSTNTVGYCYGAVTKALKPLGVELYGPAAYQARDLLLEDKRFMPLAVTNVDQLRRGDIIVYSRSGSHPYGHISVYEGDNLEASDHLAPITHTHAYGGATVFRLRNAIRAGAPVIAKAPGYKTPGYKTAKAGRRDKFRPAADRIADSDLPDQSYKPASTGRVRRLLTTFRVIRNSSYGNYGMPSARSLAFIGLQQFLNHEAGR